MVYRTPKVGTAEYVEYFHKQRKRKGVNVQNCRICGKPYSPKWNDQDFAASTCSMACFESVKGTELDPARKQEGFSDRMNIFVTDTNPIRCAHDMPDIYTTKMLLESMQLLSTAIHEWVKAGNNPIVNLLPTKTTEDADGLHVSVVTDSGIRNLYKPTHFNHPCAVWVREDPAHFLWLLTLAQYLYKEYSDRYKKPHLTGELVSEIRKYIPEQHGIELTTSTKWALAMPDQFKQFAEPDDPTQAYRMYIAAAKFRFAKWNHGVEEPSWWYEARLEVQRRGLEIQNLKNDGVK